MLMVAGLHLLGLVCVAVLLIPALREGPDIPPGSDGSDGGWGGGRDGPSNPPSAPRGGIPLPDADQARVRLRDNHRRVFDELPRRERRPAREPARTPVPS
jgi:hypothetical protein